MKILTIFKRDSITKLVIPEFAHDFSWTLTRINSLMTIMLDGIPIEVSWSQPNTCWQLNALATHSRLRYTLSNKLTEDIPVFDAFNAMTVKSNGIYLAYGLNINGNPHKLSKSLMIRLQPVNYNLVVARNKTLVDRSLNTTTQRFYDTLKQELIESPEIKGFVFHLEDAQGRCIEMGKIKRTDFGLSWPVNVMPTTGIKSDNNVIQEAVIH